MVWVLVTLPCAPVRCEGENEQDSLFRNLAGSIHEDVAIIIGMIMDEGEVRYIGVDESVGNCRRY